MLNASLNSPAARQRMFRRLAYLAGRIQAIDDATKNHFPQPPGDLPKMQAEQAWIKRTLQSHPLASSTGRPAATIADPSPNLPFTQTAFQASVDDPNLPVKLKSGGGMDFGAAARLYSKRTGISDFRATKLPGGPGSRDLEAGQELYAYKGGGVAGVGATVGFNRGQTQLARGRA